MTLFRREARADHPTDSLMELMRRRMPGVHASPVTYDTALTHSAVYECVDLIADLVAGFPVQRFSDRDGVRLPASGRSVVDNPSTEDDPVNWRRILVVSWLLRGYAAGVVPNLDDRAQPTGIELIHPDRISVERVRRDAPAVWRLDGEVVERWPNGPLWVAPGKKLSPGDPLGRSVLEFAALEIGMGLAARRFGSDFFTAGGHPTSLVIGDGEVNKDLATRVKSRFLEASSSREPVVMGGGWKYEQIQIAPNESQFLETIKANRTMVAGFFKVPPSRIGAPSGDGMTYKNVEADGIDLLRFCVGPWVNRMEVTLNPLTPRGQYVKLNMDSLLRPDLGTRYRAHDVAIRAGFKSVNDVRRIEDLPPIPTGDVYLWPPYRAQLSEAELQTGADGEVNDD